MNKYAKIVLLSTLGEPKTLVDISTTWFQNKGRLYQPPIMNEIKKAVQQKILIQEGKFYSANIPKLLEMVFKDINMGEQNKLFQEYKQELSHFYTVLGDYTKKCYLNFEIIKCLTGLNQNKAEEIDLRLVIQLPFLLRIIEYKDKDLANVVIQVMGLEEYVKLVEKLEIQHYHILKVNNKIDDWVESFDSLSKTLLKMQKKGLTIFKKNVEAVKMLGG